MKKTLGIVGALVVVLLIGIGLFYLSNTKKSIDLKSCSSYFDGCNTCIVQNGEITGCTRKYCEQPEEPKCLESVGTQTESTGIDLTNCVSYFDGCNNCTVVDGKPEACTMMYCEKPSEPKCLQYK